MSSDQLWDLHEQLVAELSRKIAADKIRLDERLYKLDRASGRLHQHRPYPKVFPKYRNPKNPEETWAGRGRQPCWLIAELRSGKKLDDFRIEQSAVGQTTADRAKSLLTNGVDRRFRK